MRDLETTAQIRREDLTELLELEKAPSMQRTTARMPAVTLTNLLCSDDDVALPTIAGTKRARVRGTRRDVEMLEMRPLTPPPAEMPAAMPVVRFRATGQHAAAWPLDHWPSVTRGLVIMASCTVTLLVVLLLTLL